MAYEQTSSEARMQFYADTIGVEPVTRILADDGTPSHELLRFCDRYGASLDWIFCGDLRMMIRDSYRQAKNYER